jgi:hypothetical protein
MAILGAGVSRIYDLDAGHVTTIYSDTRTYNVESFGVFPPRFDGARVSVRETGKTFTLYRQDASEYEIISSETHLHPNKAAARLLCWVANRAPSPELEEFGKMWFARTSLPFSPALLILPQGSFAYRTLLAAQFPMPGYLLGLIAEARNRAHLQLSDRSSASYQAYYEDSPGVLNHPHASEPPTIPYDPFVHEYPGEFLLQINLRNFTSVDFDPNAFAIPPGFRAGRIRSGKTTRTDLLK